MSLNLRLFYNSTLRIDKVRLLCGRYSSTQSNTTNDDIIDITSVEEVPKYEEIITEDEARAIMIKRDKSRLDIQHRNRLLNLPPYNNRNLTWFHETIRYKKRMFGRYGMKGLNVPVGVLWPVEEEIADKIEFEKAATPHTVQEGWAIIARHNHEKAEGIRLREEDIVKKMGKVEQWQKEFYGKIAKKEAEVRAARERKERLIEDVRRQLGFTIDPHDARFKLALEQKEKEDKKRKKEEKKQARSARVLAQLLEQSTPVISEDTQTKATETKE